MKICNKCGLTKPCSEFHRQCSTKDGYNGSCKNCRKSKWYDFEIDKDQLLEFFNLLPDKI